MPTTISLTPEQRLWLLDLLSSSVEDHEVNTEDTDPTPPNIEWARNLAEHLAGEIAALAE